MTFVRLIVFLGTLFGLAVILAVSVSRQPVETTPHFSSESALEESLRGKSAKEVQELLGEPAEASGLEGPSTWRYRNLLPDSSLLVVVNFNAENNVTNLLFIRTSAAR